jgi:urease accessory protein
MNFTKSAENTPLPNPPPQGGREHARGSGVAAASEGEDRVFAANRASSRIAVSIEANGGASRPKRVREEGSLRVRFPGALSDELEAVVVNTAGGIAGGDDLKIAFSAGPGVRLVATGAAAEKVYRSLGPDASMRVKLDIATGATLAWLPQETIVFDRARMNRSIEVDLAADARLILAEAVIFGRSGMGESVESGFVLDRWRVRRDGRLLFADALRLDGAIAEKLAAPACADGAVAVASVLVIPGDDALVDSVREQTFLGEVGISAWNGFALARLVADTGAKLRQDLVTLLMLLRAGCLPRLWLN